MFGLQAVLVVVIFVAVGYFMATTMRDVIQDALPFAFTAGFLALAMLGTAVMYFMGERATYLKAKNTHKVFKQCTESRVEVTVVELPLSPTPNVFFQDPILAANQALHAIDCGCVECVEENKLLFAWTEY